MKRASKVKVLFVSTNLVGGGTERVVSYLLRYLDRSRFTPGLALFESKIEYPLPEDLPIFVLGKRNWSDYLRLVWRLSGLYREWEPDIVLSFLPYPNNIAILARMVSPIKTRVILSEHGIPSFRMAHNNRLSELIFLRWLPRRLYPEADRLVCVSCALARDAEKVFRVPAGKINVIYPPLDIPAISLLARQKVEHPWFDEDIPVLINVGSLTPVKGHQYLLRAFREAAARYPCRLMLLGKGALEIPLKTLARQLGLEDKVFFAGFQSNPFQYLSRSAIYTLSSLSEALPMAVLEAMCCGLPVIATAFPGSDELVTPGVNGLVVPPGDEAGLANAIMELLANRELASRLATAGKTKANEFALPAIIKTYEDCIEAVLV